MAVTLAHQWELLLQNSEDLLITGAWSLSWKQWHISSTAEGWIICLLSLEGMFDWLQAVVAELAAISPGYPPVAGTPQPPNGQFQLCTQLQLSLPMVLQFGHVRCEALIRQFQASNGEPAAPFGSSSRDALSASEFELLRAIAQVTDALATAQRPATSLREAYGLVEAIYRFESTFWSIPVPRAPIDQQKVTTLLKAAQAVLAAVIIGVLGQTPVPTF